MMRIIKHKFNNNSMHALILPRSVSFGSFGSFGSRSILGTLASGGLPCFHMDKKNRRCFVTRGGTNPIIPVMSYTDLLIQKKQIMQDNHKKSGIYR